MNLIARAILRLYPRAWRDRYGAEFAALVEDTGGSRHWYDLLSGAISIRLLSPDARLVGAFTLAGLVVGLSFACMSPIRYVSSAQLRFEPAREADPSVMADVKASILDRVVHDHARLSHLLRIPPTGISARLASGDLSVSSPELASPIAISSVAGDPATARAMTQKLVARLYEENQWTQERLAHTGYGTKVDPRHVRRFGGGSILKIVRPPSRPARPDSAKRWTLVAVGALAGLLAAFAAFSIRNCPRLALAGAFTMVAVAAVLSFPGAILPLPYTSLAEVAFDSPETMRLLAGAPPVVRSRGAGAWFHLDLQPLSPTRMRVAVRYSNPFTAEMILNQILTEMNQRAFTTRMSTRGQYEAPMGPYLYLVRTDRERAFPGHDVLRLWLLFGAVFTSLAAIYRLGTAGRRGPEQRLRTA